MSKFSTQSWSVSVQYTYAAMYLGNGKCSYTRDKVASCTPHHKCITNTWKHETSQHLAWVGIVLWETHAMHQYKEHQRYDRETLDNAANWRFWTRLIAEQNEVDCRCFEERHQLWANTFKLKKWQNNTLYWFLHADSVSDNSCMFLGSLFTNN